MIPNLMHSLDRTSNELLLKKVYDALVPKGRVIIVELVPNEDRVSPRIPALFALTMLANNSGDAYTVSEYRAMLSTASFLGGDVHPLGTTPFTAITCRQALVIAEEEKRLTIHERDSDQGDPDDNDSERGIPEGHRHLQRP